MWDMVDKELDRLLAEDIIEPVQYSNWAAQVVPVMKADKTVRLCGDYKLTVNQVAKLDRYPLPRIEGDLVSVSKVVQLSMDGPNVNLKLHALMDEELCSETEGVPALLSVGSCGLHTVLNAFKAGAKASERGIEDILSSRYWLLFTDSPARREDFTAITSSDIAPIDGSRMFRLWDEQRKCDQAYVSTFRMWRAKNATKSQPER